MYRAALLSRDGQKLLLIVAFTRTEIQEMQLRHWIDVEDLSSLDRPGLWLAISAGDQRLHLLQAQTCERQLRDQYGQAIETMRHIFIPESRIQGLLKSPATARRFFVRRIDPVTKIMVFFGTGHAMKEAFKRHNINHLYDAPHGPLASTQPRRPEDN